MKELFLSLSLYFAFAILSVGVFFQMLKVRHRKTSGDISLVELTLRLIASFVLLTKFAVISETHLIIGQGLFTATYLLYYTTVLRIRAYNHFMNHNTPL